MWLNSRFGASNCSTVCSSCSKELLGKEPLTITTGFFFENNRRGKEPLLIEFIERK